MLLKSVIDVTFLISRGREFQIRGPHDAKALSPYVFSRAWGSTRRFFPLDLKERGGLYGTKRVLM